MAIGAALGLVLGPMVFGNPGTGLAMGIMFGIVGGLIAPWRWWRSRSGGERDAARRMLVVCLMSGLPVVALGRA